MRQVYKDGFGVGFVIANSDGNLRIKWTESDVETTEKEKDVKDVIVG